MNRPVIRTLFGFAPAKDALGFPAYFVGERRPEYPMLTTPELVFPPIVLSTGPADDLPWCAPLPPTLRTPAVFLVSFPFAERWTIAKWFAPDRCRQASNEPHSEFVDRRPATTPQ